MKFNNKKDNKNKYFACNAAECFSSNKHISDVNSQQYSETYKKDNTSCPFCAYNVKNTIELQNQIQKESEYNKRKRNILKAKLWEYVIVFSAILLFFGYVTYYLFKILLINK